MLFQPIYQTRACDLPGYGDLAVVVLANPTNKQWANFLDGGLDASHLLERADNETNEAWEQRRATNRAERREQLGQGLVALYGGKTFGPLDFSTPQAAIATIEHDDLPDEIVQWLMELPITVRRERIEAMQKKLRRPLTPEG